MKIFLMSLSLLSASAFAAPKAKVNVCHFSSDEGTYHLINIAQPAVQAHINHGDVLAPAVGATVTVNLGSGITLTLDSNCTAL